MAIERGLVLDSSALLAWLLSEPGANAIEPMFDAAVVCSVNLSETLTELIRRGAAPDQAETLLRGMQLEAVAWTEELTWQGRDLCPLAWSHGLSLGDRACLTTARALGRTAITADVSWITAVEHLQSPIRVALFRSPGTTRP